jgi:hypothetical protein
LKGIPEAWKGIIDGTVSKDFVVPELIPELTKSFVQNQKKDPFAIITRPTELHQLIHVDSSLNGLPEQWKHVLKSEKK